MSYLNLNALLQDVNNYMESSLNSGQIGPLAQTTEDRINSLVVLPTAKKEDVKGLDINTGLEDLPADFYGFVSVAINENNLTTDFIFLEQKSTDFIETAFPAANATGVPRYYALDINNGSNTGKQIIIAPKADKDYRLNIRYIGTPTSIVDGSATYIAQEFPEALFYGTLVEVANFLKEDQSIIANFENRFQQAMARVKNTVDGRMATDQYRSGENRINPS